MRVKYDVAFGCPHLGWPATALFSNFDELTRQTSLDFYRRLFGRQISENYLVAATRTKEPRSSSWHSIL